MAFETVTYTLPDHWLYALEYGSDEYMGDEEAQQFDNWETHFETEHGPYKAHEVVSDAGFMKYHDAQPFGVLACNAVEVKFLIGCPDNQD